MRYWQQFVAIYQGAEAYAALDRELPGIMVAIALAEERHGDTLLNMVDGLNTYWYVHGQWNAGREGHHRALRVALKTSDTARERGEIHALTVLDANQGRVEEARSGYGRALALAQQLGDRASEAVELRNLGILLGLRNQPQEGQAFIQKSLAISTTLGDIQGQAYCHQFLARIAEQQRDTATMRAEYTRAFPLFTQIGSPHADVVRRALDQLGT